MIENQKEREMFYVLLSWLGIELKLRSANGGPPDKNNASNNGLYFYTKDTGHILVETTVDFKFENAWNVGDEKNAARFLLESCVDFIDVSHKDPNASWRVEKVIENPFFGCANLEEAMVKIDLLSNNQ